ncbi:MAG: hypothetical protein V3T30_00185, partial [Thermodesulfobacteriota bacterium]
MVSLSAVTYNKTMNRYLYLFIILLLSGCATGQKSTLAESGLQVPSGWSSAIKECAAPLSWLKDFNDPALTGLVKEAIVNSFDLRST